MAGTIAESFGLAMGIAVITMIVFLVGSVFYIRVKVKGRVYCYILAANKQLYGYLLKPLGFSVLVGDGDKAAKFLIHPALQFWSFWPPGFPRNVQEPVPTYLFCEGNAEPIDPFNRRALISPESLMKISDESMLKQTWKDVKDSLGLKPAPLKLRPIIIGLLAAGAVGLLLYAYFNGWF